ncbi:hypothetical protein ACE41H_21570 [Paenibacillus enshidis]|uniref:Uncharacterized protein n=1 Tax=Paenibacillus enshidis TaxID=1458439 RepID=A0ABV5AZF2_9BACL
MKKVLDYNILDLFLLLLNERNLCMRQSPPTSKQPRSIGQRLEKAKSLESKKKIALDWATNWKNEHERLIKDLERAIIEDDYDLLCRATGQLKVVGQKRFNALPRVLSHISEVQTVADTGHTSFHQSSPEMLRTETKE